MNNKPSHCPSADLLVEFAAGTLGTAESICVSAHLHFCPHCRGTLHRLEQIGSHFMEKNCEAVTQKSTDKLNVAGEEDLFESVMKKIDAVGTNRPDRAMPIKGEFPPLVNKLISATYDKLNWRRLSKSVDVAGLKTGQNKFEVALHRICAGGKTPKHDHRGLEYTVVLKGSFSDEKSVYKEGDFILRQPGDTHQPMGAQNGECICLSAQSAPIKLQSFFGSMLNSWLRIRPS